MTNRQASRFGLVRPSISRRTTDDVVFQVSELIKLNQLKPGDRLPPERELAKEMGVSRQALRRGLQSLVSMGVLKSRQGSGTFIAGGPPSLDSEPLQLLAALHGFTFDHLFEARSVLEVSTAGLAAERATGAQLAAIAEEVAEMYATVDDPQQYLIHDIRFHRAVAAASGNPTLSTLVEMVSGVMYERRRQTIERAQDFTESLELHRRIYRAIRDRQPKEARAAMADHIARAQKAFALEEAEQETVIGTARTDHENP
ncbi:MAG TPA: FadR/GntR family transcriptional regulator [Acidobacteriota bacterium]|jgi:GntR family transcriptional repressor for pyruvate dehydrogenase complex